MAIPTMSNDPESHKNLSAMIEWLEERLKGLGFHVDLKDVGDYTPEGSNSSVFYKISKILADGIIFVDLFFAYFRFVFYMLKTRMKGCEILGENTVSSIRNIESKWKRENTFVLLSFGRCGSDS